MAIFYISPLTSLRNEKRTHLNHSFRYQSRRQQDPERHQIRRSFLCHRIYCTAQGKNTFWGWTTSWYRHWTPVPKAPTFSQAFRHYFLRVYGYSFSDIGIIFAFSRAGYIPLIILLPIFLPEATPKASLLKKRSLYESFAEILLFLSLCLIYLIDPDLIRPHPLFLKRI